MVFGSQSLPFACPSGKSERVVVLLEAGPEGSQPPGCARDCHSQMCVGMCVCVCVNMHVCVSVKMCACTRAQCETEHGWVGGSGLPTCVTLTPSRTWGVLTLISKVTGGFRDICV